MHRCFRIAFVVALLVSVVSWAGGSRGVAAQGTVYTDTMDASSTPLLPTQSSDPTQYTFSYQNSQYVIQTLQPGFASDLVASANVPDLTDASVAVDFAIAGDLTGKYAYVGCRAAIGGGSFSGYEFEVHPDTGVVNIWRIDPANATKLATVTDTSAVNVGNGNNRMEIRCVGNTITGLVNGQQLLTAQDTTFTSGKTLIGIGKNSETTDLMMVGFDNLIITDLAGGAVAQPTQAPAQPTQAPLQPTQATGFPTAIPAQPTAAAQPTTPALQTTPTTGTGVEGATPITDPRVDPDGTLSDAFIVSLFEEPVGGPLSANDTLVSGDFKYLSSGVNVSDFYTELFYTLPPATPAGSFAVGFTFWDDGQGNSYDMFIQGSNGVGKWGFGQSVNGTYTMQQSGDLPAGAIDFTPNAENFLSLAVYQGVVMLSGNTYSLDATVDLGASTGSGDVQAEVGFQATDTTTTQTFPVSISEFSVWDLSSGVVTDFGLSTDTTPSPEPTQAGGLPTAIPTQAPVQPTQAPVQPTQAPVQPTQATLPTVAPPPLVSPTTATGTSTTNALLQQIFDSQKSAAMGTAPVFTSASGTLTQTLDNFTVVPAGAMVTDVYATATFVNPTDLSTHCDYGIGFRDLNNNTEFRFVVGTDGTWTLSVGSAAPVLEGTLTNVNAAPGGSNTLEILAKGSTGILAVNGQVIQQVDLSANLNAGDVYIGSGMVASASVDQRQVPYSNFAVYQLTA